MKTKFWIIILTIVFLASCATPPGESDAPAKPTMTDEEAVYLSEMDDILEEYGELWIEQATLLSGDIDFDSETWKAEIDETLIQTFAANQKIRDLHCPLSCWPIHAHMLTAADYYDSYARTLVRSLIAKSADLTLEAGLQSGSGSNEIERAQTEASILRDTREE